MATFSCRVKFLDDIDPFANTSFPEPARPPTYSFLDNVPLINQIASIHRLLQAPHKVYRYHSDGQGEFGTYLDLESAIDEQADELEGFAEQRKNALVLRTQLTIRVHVIVEKLLNSTSRDLRRALFSLKQIFQDDKDLVHEFVNNDGLSCLIKVGSESDQNYQNYILRALGQVMLYVDGMEGVIQHNATIQWLYTLLASKGRLVVKTALKLLLVFVEYTESNSIQLIRAINTVDSRRGLLPWTNVMSLLSDKDGADSELLLYTMTLINKTVSAIPDQEMFYDLTDALEELEMDSVSRWHMNKQGASLDLLTQFQLYESSLMHEDGEDSSVISQGENLRQVPRKKTEGQARKSKRHDGSQDLTTAQLLLDQPLTPDVSPVAPRRKKREQKESPPVESSPSENEPAAHRNNLPTPEMISALSQHVANTHSPQNSRTRRRNRQRSFIEEKQELLNVLDRHDHQQGQPSKSASETAVSTVRPSSGYFNTESVLPSLFSSVLSDPVLPGSDRADGRFISQSEHLSQSNQSWEPSSASTDVARNLSSSYNKQVIESGKTLELVEESSYFTFEQIMSDSNPPPLHVLDTTQPLQPTESERFVNIPVQNFNNNIPDENSQSQLISSDMSYSNSSQRRSQPHQPHFHNHYQRSVQENHIVDHPSFPVFLNKDHSFDGRNLFSKEPSVDESRFQGFTEDRFTPQYIEPTNNPVIDHRSDPSPTYNNQGQRQYGQGYSNDDYLKSLQSQKTVENGQLGGSEGQVKILLNKLNNEPAEAPRESLGPFGDISGIISNARGNLTRQNAPKQFSIQAPAVELDTKEFDFQWDVVQRRLRRQLKVKDMDFTDLQDEDDVDSFSSSVYFNAGPLPSPIPPPPPPLLAGDLLSPRPPSNSYSQLSPPSGSFLFTSSASSLPPPLGADLKKNKKTVRLHWRALPTDNPHPTSKDDIIWKHLVPVNLDTEKLEHLFETKTSEVKSKKQDSSGKKEIAVLDPKRSNAINIGLTVLPPPRSIKAAVLKMDNSIMSKEGIEKILNAMIPTEEEKAKILEAQMANPDIPLGTAEQFLLTLSSIIDLEARLKLWLFKLDYELSEQELAEPLMDLKKGVAELQRNRTFRCILSGVLTIGNFLNGVAVHAFNVEFLQRLPEIKDTVRKHSLVHHLCTLIIEQFPDTTDLYSEIGPITRCSRVDFDELAHKLNKMENECKASWNHLQEIVKHDGSSTDLKGKMSLFLADAAERIMILKTIFKRILNRYNKMLLFLGLPVTDAREMKVNHFCKVISEFALEYRTTRDKVIQMMQKKANQRERKKTRGKMIVDTKNFQSKDRAHDDALDALLKNRYTGTEEIGLPGQRNRRRIDSRSAGSKGGMTITDSDLCDTADDDILEACVKTATAPTLHPHRERKRARHQRKSLRRTLKGGLVKEEVQAIKSYSNHV